MLLWFKKCFSIKKESASKLNRKLSKIVSQLRKQKRRQLRRGIKTLMRLLMRPTTTSQPFRVRKLS